MFPVLARSEGSHDEPDRLNDLAHPREVLALVGHQHAEAEILEGWNSGRLHHAWLITGEQGIGKATLAYRIARFVLAASVEPAGGQTSLFVPPDARAAQLIAAMAHPDLAVIRRSYNTQSKSVASEIRVDDVRKALEIFEKTAAFGGYRVCIVDCCDDLNISAANALLKTLEEPPARSLFLLVAHSPGRILPTIRSRCRQLPLKPLSPDQVDTILSGLIGTDANREELRKKAALRGRGSVRRAASILDARMLAMLERLEASLAAFPQSDAAQIDGLADIPAGRNGEAAYRAVIDTCAGWVEARLQDASDKRIFAIAEAWTAIEEKRRSVEALNLDRRAFVVDMLMSLAAAMQPA